MPQPGYIHDYRLAEGDNSIPTFQLPDGYIFREGDIILICITAGNYDPTIPGGEAHTAEFNLLNQRTVNSVAAGGSFDYIYTRIYSSWLNVQNTALWSVSKTVDGLAAYDLWLSSTIVLRGTLLQRETITQLGSRDETNSTGLVANSDAQIVYNEGTGNSSAPSVDPSSGAGGTYNTGHNSDYVYITLVSFLGFTLIPPPVSPTGTGRVIEQRKTSGLDSIQQFIVIGRTNDIDSLTALTFDWDVVSNPWIATFFGLPSSSTNLPTLKHRTIPDSHILVKVDWPNNTRYYSDVPVVVGSQGWSGKLHTIGSVLITSERQLDTVEFIIDHGNNPKAEFLSDIWDNSLSDPPEESEVTIYMWFEGDTEYQKIELFRGAVEAITDINAHGATITAVTLTSKYSIDAGKLINTTDYTDAPADSIGRIEPLLLGIHERFEGVPVTTIGKTALAAVVLDSDTSLTVEDGTDFPTSAFTIIIGEEEITVGTRTANSFTSLTRGASSTTAKSYGPGEPVLEKGNLDILVSALTYNNFLSAYGVSGDRIAVIDPALYTEVAGPPDLIRFAGGWPTIPVVLDTSEFVQIEMTSVDVDTLAGNPAFAAGGTDSYLDTNSARLSDTLTPLKLLKSDEAVSKGKFARSYLLVEFDAEDLGVAIAAGDSVAIYAGSSPTSLGDLVVEGGVPDPFLDKIKVLTRTYDDTHDHEILSAATETTTQKHCDYSTDGWNYDPSYSLTPQGGGDFDGSAAGYAYNTNSPHLKRMFFPIDSGSPIVPGTDVLIKFRIIVKHGGHTSTKQGGYFAWSPLGNTEKWHITSVHCSGTDSAPGTAYSPWIYTSDWTEITRSSAGFYYSNGDIFGVLGGARFYQCTLEYVHSTNPVTDVIKQKTAVRGSTAQLFELSSSLIDAWTDIKSFNVEARFTDVASSGDEVRIVRMGLVVEYFPNRTTPADRIVLDAKESFYNGVPIDVIHRLLDFAITASTAYVAGFNALAASPINAIPLYLDFATSRQFNLMDLLEQLMFEAKMIGHWREGKLFIQYQHDIDDMVPFMTFTEDAHISSHGISRTPIDKVYNEIAGRYEPDDYYQRPISDYTKTRPALTITPKSRSMDLEAVRTSAHAIDVIDVVAERGDTPRYTVRIVVGLVGLEVWPGDKVGVTLDWKSWTKVEIHTTIINIGDDPMTVTLIGVAFDGAYG